ncbi:MAG TPA: DUF192 domain-containing protein [bacterium]|nr:DUF192 domain-containing protein [bacterium]
MRMQRVAAVVATGAAAVVAALLGAGPGSADGPCQALSFPYKHGIVTFTEAGQTTQVRVEIADTHDTQEYGLMCRTTLEPDAGMLFAFADATKGAFWMKDTLIPLSIAFIDSGWHIVSMMDMKVEPDPANPVALYAPPRPYRYALEVNQGFFAQHGIDAGAQISFLPDPAKGP